MHICERLCLPFPTPPLHCFFGTPLVTYRRHVVDMGWAPAQARVNTVAVCVWVLLHGALAAWDVAILGGVSWSCLQHAHY
jgi:hypothetical protein